MSPKSWYFRRFSVTGALAALIGLGGLSPTPPDEKREEGAPRQNSGQLVLLAAGDVDWTLGAKESPLEMAFINLERPGEAEWRSLPFLNSPESIEYLRELGISNPFERTDGTVMNYSLRFDTDEELVRHPFLRIRETFHEADIVFLNLETPLSNDARRTGAFRTPSRFADALSWAGVSVVALANNHALDAGEEGLLDTMSNLERAGVGFTGGGRNLDEARRPWIVKKNGIRVGFLAYTCHVNIRSNQLQAGFALPGRSGVAPLNPVIVTQDIQSVRDQVDHVIVSFHWGPQNTSEVHPLASRLARAAIDAGAEVVLGHHPHVPQAIEVYRGKPIIHSLGNFVFGHNHTYWGDNILARITLTRQRVERLEVVPVAGEGEDLAQPYVLKGDRAKVVLDAVKRLSADEGTRLTIEGDVAVVDLETDAEVAGHLVEADSQ
jgi:poly-gamma-glutamate capsule biosynthesis protein CapA/YwtB (metallophosphatase superfamily)